MILQNETPYLSPRLRTVANLAGSATCVADIGSDHAQLPVALVRSGRASRAIVVEITQGPWETARTAVLQAGLAQRIDVRKGDGFLPIRPGECDVVVIAGMGARAIWHILTLPHALECLSFASLRIVAQPMGSAALLRFLAQVAGLTIKADVLVRDGAILYECVVLELQANMTFAGFRARGAQPFLADFDALAPFRRASLVVGEEPLRRRDPLAKEVLDAYITKLARAQSGADLSRSRQGLRRAASFAEERKAAEALRGRYFGA